MQSNNTISQARLKELLSYNPDTGLFTWVTKYGSHAVIGKIAGSLHTASGYWTIRLDKKLYKAHRLAWLYIHGQMPDCPIDHINHNRNDNRLSNLRLAVRGDLDNGQNRKGVNSNNTTGFLGVTFCKSTGRYRAQIICNRKRIPIGRYKTPEEAHAAYMAKKLELHPFYHHA